MRGSAYYQDFLGRHNCRWFAGLSCKAGDDLWAVSIQRTIAQGPFLADEVEKLRRLMRPLAEAATLTRKLGFARVEGLAEALDLIGQPCIVFDDRGRVLTINALADGLIGAMIDVKSQELSFGDPVSQSRFHSLLAAASANAPGTAQQPAVAAVRDRHGVRHFVRAIALRGWMRYAFTGARALVLFEKAKPSSEAALALLRTTFGLTPAEARLAIELGKGHSLTIASQNLGVTYHTARSYLKSLFMKMDIHRQAELVALLLHYISGC
jgi:DNA-binding CsgD family transcriptional regulator